MTRKNEPTGEGKDLGGGASDPSETVAGILDRLDGVRETGMGWSATCPAHPDQDSALAIAEGEDGRCFLHCFDGCEPEAVVRSIGLELSDLEADGDRRRPLGALLVQLALERGARLFHDGTGRAFAWVPIADHFEVWPVDSRSFKRWLRRQLHRHDKRVAGSQALTDAIELLCAKAEFDGPQHETFTRVGAIGDEVWLDLADDEWRAIRVSAAGWEVTASVPVPFIRNGATRPLPMPERGGSIDDLRKFVNVPSEHGWRLIAALIVMALQTRGPFPILILQGEKGSAKSTTAKVIRALVDPAAAPLRAGNPSERDLMIAATSSWIVGFDNLSRVRERLADALCQLSTGAGFGTRRLFTDDEEFIFEAMRPILLNGIAELATRPDLLSRSIVLELPVLAEHRTVSEREFWAQFEEARPRILGSLLDVLAGVQGVLPEIELDQAPRMADFARLGVAVEQVLGWPDGSFLEAFIGQQTAALAASLDSDPLGAALLKLMADRVEWSGTATELFEKLTSTADDEVTRRRSWPTNAAITSKRLKELLPALREAGLEIDWTPVGRGKTKQRGILIHWIGDGGDAGDA